MQSLGKYAPYALAVLRIVTALLFIEHGTAKLFGFPAMPGPGHAGGLSPLMLIGALLELWGDHAIRVGFITRPVAVIRLCRKSACPECTGNVAVFVRGGH